MVTHELDAPGARRSRAPDLVVGALVGLGVGLRLWALGAARLSFDETFTAVAARMPLGSLLSFLRRADAHPPLDYLLRAPLARAGVSEAWLRAPSVVASALTLILAAWWWRRLGRVGILAVALLAVSPFAIVYAHDARMYAGLGLAGMVVAVASARWLERPSKRLLLVMGVGLLSALFLQGGALLVVPGVIAVAGLRRDRDAWRWRLSVIAACLVWGVVWGRAFLDQSGRSGSSWVPLTTPHYALVVLNELVDTTPVIAILAVGLVIGGLLTLPSGPLRRVVACLGAGVIGTYLVMGLHFHVLLPRALAFAAWAPLLALASLVDAALRHARSVGVAILALVTVVVVPSTIAAAQVTRAPHAAAFDSVRRFARPGDEVVMTPGFLRTMPTWYFGVRWWAHGSLVSRSDLAAEGIIIGGTQPTGRVWLVVSVDYPAQTAGLRACAPPRRMGGFTVYCLDGAHGA